MNKALGIGFAAGVFMGIGATITAWPHPTLSADNISDAAFLSDLAETKDPRLDVCNGIFSSVADQLSNETYEGR